MKGGIVVTIRLNPQDVMAAVDIVDKAGAYVPGMSISQAIKMAFEGCMAAARTSAAIPSRDGFEYEQMVSRFKGVSASRKRAVTETMEAAQIGRMILDKPHTIGNFQLNTAPAELPPEVVQRKAKIMVRLNELDFKLQADPDNMEEQEKEERAKLRVELAQLNTL